MQKSVLFLGAGKPANGDLPSGLNITSKNSTIMDWLLSLFPAENYKRLFAGGYRIDKFKKNFQDLEIYKNEHWNETSASSSLFLLIKDLKDRVTVTYTDILFRKTLVNRIENKSDNFDVVVAVDSSWHVRFNRNSKDDLAQSEFVSCFEDNLKSLHYGFQKYCSTSEFCGVFSLSINAINFLKNLSNERKKWFSIRPPIELLEYLRINGFSFSYVDVEADWAELNDPRDIARFLLGTKAETLERLKKLTKKSTIFDQITFSVKDWMNTHSTIVESIQSKYPDQKVIVRSSSQSEDTFESSAAGVYDSIQDVFTDKTSLHTAISSVINSFKNRNLEDQVLIQEMASNIIASGVLFTRGLCDSSPYYTINFDDHSGQTDSITTGNAINSRVIKLFRNWSPSKLLPNWIITLIRSVREIEGLLSIDTLDIEFAIGVNKEVYIFQVRPLKINTILLKDNDNELKNSLKNLEPRIASLLKKSQNLLGKTNILGSMPDWNPAEIIGNHPGRLAYDLYDYLVTSETWAIQRYEYGYKDTRPSPLMIELLGQPYIDCRASFNSFVPQGINDELASKLVDHYIRTLQSNPKFHDKIEFNVVPTCLNLNFLKWENQLSDAGFYQNEILELKNSLQRITVQAISNYPKSFDALEELEKRRKYILESNETIVSKISLLLKNIKTLGVLPFAHFARDAFVAADLLKSGVELKLLSNDAYNSFMYSLSTVTSDYANDVKLFLEESISREVLIEKYGHLRPNTYNILSKRYDEDPDFYLNPSKDFSETQTPNYIDTWNKEKNNFLNEIVNLGLSKTKFDAEFFLKSSIENREKAKFIFTRSLSDTLELIKKYSVNIAIDLNKVSEARLTSILSSENLTNHEAHDLILNSAKMFGFKKYGQLPELISNTNDIFAFEQIVNSGNFIGNKCVTGETAYYSKSNSDSLEGKIVFIDNADPGYDWLFGKNIIGLITKFGGANSHMAIRCAEFGLPALIGAGESLFEALTLSKKIQLDCHNRNCKLIS